MKIECIIISAFIFMLTITVFIPASALSIEDDKQSNSICGVEAEIINVIECGDISVPENRQKDNGRTFKLPFLRIKATNPSPDHSPWLFLPGGPGGAMSISQKAGIEWWANVSRIFAPHRDFIAMEMRGTRDTIPSFNCPTLNTTAVGLNAVPSNQNATPPKNRIDAEIEECREILNERGLDLSTANRLENISDIKALLERLNVKKVSLFGVSYGSTLAMTFAEKYPELVDMMILDSVYPPEISDDINESLHLEKLLPQIFEVCEKQPTCNEKYPNLEEKFHAFFDDLKREPLAIEFIDHSDFVQKTAFLDQKMFLNFLLMMLPAQAGEDEMLQHFPEILVNKNKEVIEYWFQHYAAGLIQNSFSFGAYLSGMCNDLSDDLDIEELFDSVSSIQKIALEGWGLIQHCKKWHTLRSSPNQTKPLVSDIPTLILNSKYDLVTPPHQAKIAARNLENSYFFEFPGGLHGLYERDFCAIYLMQEFLYDHSKRPSSSCADNFTDFKFKTDFKHWISPFVTAP